MRIILVFLLLVFSVLAAQSPPDTTVLKRYYALDFPFFHQKAAESPDSDLYLALRSNIHGETYRMIHHLDRALPSLDTGIKQEVARMLVDGYRKTGNRPAAERVARHYGVDSGMATFTDSNGNFLVQVAGVDTPTDSTTVEFDQFYFDAVVGEDSVRVFLDTGAPGISVDERLVRKYGWPTDTASAGKAVLPYLGVQYPLVPTLVSSLKIGDFTFENLPATFGAISEENRKKLNRSGIEDTEILMGLDAFFGLIDGVEVDYGQRKLRLISRLPRKPNVCPNFLHIEGKPAIRFLLAGQSYSAWIDTGSPRHVFTREMIDRAEIAKTREDRYGDYAYNVHTLTVDSVLNLSDVQLEAADYGRRSSSEARDISAHFGSFLGKNLAFDLRNRIVEIR